MSVKSNLNKLQISDHFDRRGMQIGLSAIYNITNKQGFDKLYIDFSNLDSISSSEMLPFACYCRNRILDGCEIILELPKNQKLKRLFLNCNWAHLIDPRQFEESDNFQTHMPALIYKDYNDHAKVINMVVEVLLSQITGSTRDSLGTLDWVINEITDNVLNHAESKIGGVVQVTVHKTTN